MVTSLSIDSPFPHVPLTRSPSCVQRFFCALLAALLIHEVLFCCAISFPYSILWYWSSSRCSSPVGARYLELNWTASSWCLGTLNFLWSASMMFRFPWVFQMILVFYTWEICCLVPKMFFPFRAFLNRTSLFQSQPPNPVTSGSQVSYHIGITLSGYNIALHPRFVNRF